ncbi:hypothetical protein EF294_05765 [Gordonia oryzae]|uniref:Uncharacterized protein n=1 Tax=Gordonia oryzae TaxID=2487349 RepID=A0A3N4GQV1_9ACTN|nr:hypothetical protein [Gordonia oryzae]RPA65329.1 hypothetical protein EF294_05765 [Gordonia oryzae]
MQIRSSVIDVLVRDDADAVAGARHCLSLLPGQTSPMKSARSAIGTTRVFSENRLRACGIQAVIDGIADVGSVQWLRPSTAAASSPR